MIIISKATFHIITTTLFIFCKKSRGRQRKKRGGALSKWGDAPSNMGVHKIIGGGVCKVIWGCARNLGVP
jgi:hypothetical protein